MIRFWWRSKSHEDRRGLVQKSMGAGASAFLLAMMWVPFTRGFTSGSLTLAVTGAAAAYGASRWLRRFELERDRQERLRWEAKDEADRRERETNRLLHGEDWEWALELKRREANIDRILGREEEPEG